MKCLRCLRASTSDTDDGNSRYCLLNFQIYSWHSAQIIARCSCPIYYTQNCNINWSHCLCQSCLKVPGYVSLIVTRARVQLFVRLLCVCLGSSHRSNIFHFQLVVNLKKSVYFLLETSKNYAWADNNWRFMICVCASSSVHEVAGLYNLCSYEKFRTCEVFWPGI